MVAQRQGYFLCSELKGKSDYSKALHNSNVRSDIREQEVQTAGILRVGGTYFANIKEIATLVWNQSSYREKSQVGVVNVFK